MSDEPLLLQKIDAALADGKARGKFKSAREWSKLAGLSDNYVGVLRTRLKSGEVKQAKSEELGKLGAVLGLSVGYFLGSADGRDEIENLTSRSIGSSMTTLDAAIQTFKWPVLPVATARAIVKQLRDDFVQGSEALSELYWLAQLEHLVSKALETKPKKKP